MWYRAGRGEWGKTSKEEGRKNWKAEEVGGWRDDGMTGEW